MKRIVAICLVLMLCLLVGCDTAAPAPEETAAPTQQNGVVPTRRATTAEPESSEPSAPAGGPYFTREGETQEEYVFTNHAVQIRLEGEDVFRKNLSTGEESVLFSVEKEEGIQRYLVGVTNQRLYFSWNDGEWFGQYVYSVNYQGGDRQDLDGMWRINQSGGWLVLESFHTDVSQIRMILIDRNDKVVFEEEALSVWDVTVVDESVYYVYIEDVLDVEDVWSQEGWVYDLIRIDADGTKTILKSFDVKDYYTPVSLYHNTVSFLEQGEYYDMFTLEPVGPPQD